MFLPQRAGRSHEQQFGDVLVEYHYNAFGYRSLEFHAIGNYFLAAGTGHTEGIALPVEQIWSSVIGKTYHLSVANLGIQHAAAHTIALNINNWLLGAPRHRRWQLPRPKFVIVQWPGIDSEHSGHWLEAVVVTNRLCRALDLPIVNFCLAHRDLDLDERSVLERDSVVIHGLDNWPMDHAAADCQHHSAACHERWAAALMDSIAYHDTDSAR